MELIKEKLPEAVVIQNKRNLGFAKAANLGILEAKGRYVFLLNPDTRFESDAVLILADFLDNHPEAAAAGPRQLESDGKVSRFSARELPSLLNVVFRQVGLRSLFPESPLFGRETFGPWDRLSLRQVPYINGAAIMIRRQVFEKYGLLDETLPMYYEDLEFSARLNRNKERVFFVPAAVIVHQGRGSSDLSPNRAALMAMQDGEAPWRFFREYRSYTHAFVYRGLILAGSLARLMALYFRRALKNESRLRKRPVYEEELRLRTLARWALLTSNEFRRTIENVFSADLKSWVQSTPRT